MCVGLIVVEKPALYNSLYLAVKFGFMVRKGSTLQTKVILAVDTSSDTASYCIVRNQQVLGTVIADNSLPHSRSFFHSLQQLMQIADLGISEISVFAGVTGPGSFTGVRVGLAALKGLCQSAKGDLLGIDSLSLVALNENCPGRYLVLQENRHHELFAGLRVINERFEIHTTQEDTVGSSKSIFNTYKPELKKNCSIIGSGVGTFLSSVQQEDVSFELESLASNFDVLAFPLAVSLGLYVGRQLKIRAIESFRPLQAHYVRAVGIQNASVYDNHTS
jgi:tRNA threonylcarbamoyladenosine biosynthesis protein TsaB